MDLSPDQVASLLVWLLEAAPVQRKYLLTRLAQRRPSALGAQLFGALLREGRPADALRLLRHAGALGDDELAELAREHLIAPQVSRAGWVCIAPLDAECCLELWMSVHVSCEVGAI